MIRVSLYKLASVLLQYPTMALFDGAGELGAAASAAPRATQRPFGTGAIRP
jgi:nitrate reductase molybdenum cofactor assembly chaperone NarJ/NarW